MRSAATAHHEFCLDFFRAVGTEQDVAWSGHRLATQTGHRQAFISPSLCVQGAVNAWRPLSTASSAVGGEGLLSACPVASCHGEARWADSYAKDWSPASTSTCTSTSVSRPPNFTGGGDEIVEAVRGQRGRATVPSAVRPLCHVVSDSDWRRRVALVQDRQRQHVNSSHAQSGLDRHTAFKLASRLAPLAQTPRPSHPLVDPTRSCRVDSLDCPHRRKCTLLPVQK